MYTSLIYKDSTAFPQEVAHVYEHWFIASFFDYIEREFGYDRGVLGYVGGETFSNILFIEAWFYSQEMADAFRNFVVNEQLEPTILSTCMQQCGAEDTELWSVEDKPLLHTQLSELANLPWLSDSQLRLCKYSDTKPYIQSPIMVQKSAASYRTLTIKAKLVRPSMEDQALMQRLHVILSDIIGRFIQRHGWYEYDNQSLREDGDGLYFLHTISLPKKTVTKANVEDLIQDHIRSFDVHTNMPLIKDHFTLFSNEPLWKGRVREELHYLDVILSNRHIAELAVEDRIQRIFAAVKISVSSVSKSLENKA